MNQVHQFPKRNSNDFEQFLNDLVKKFKNRRGGGGQGGKPGEPGLAPILVGAAVAVLLIWAAFTSYYTVDVGYQAVVTRFGKYIETTDRGLHFKLPFGVDTVYLVPAKRTFQEEFGFRTASSRDGKSYFTKDVGDEESLMLTGDLNVADVEWAVQYRIKDPWKFLFHARDVTRNIRDLSMSIMRRVVGDRLAGEVLTTARVEIAADAKQLTQEVLDEYDMGIHIEQVILQDVNPPDPVKPAFNEVNAAKQEQEEAINNAERQYNKVIPEARGKAEKLLSDAEAFAIDVVNRAKGDANRFNQMLTEYKKAPAVTRDRMYLETMEEIFSNLTQFTVVDKDAKGLLPVYGDVAGALSKPTSSKQGD